MREQIDPASKREMLIEILMQKHRGLFPSLTNKSYFNFGAQGLLAQPGIKAMQDYFERLTEYAPFTIDHTMDFLKIFSTARNGLADLLNVSNETLSLVENTSFGCNIAIWGQSWRKGDRILLSDSEYPGVLASVETLANRYELQIDYFSVRGNHSKIFENLMAALKRETRLVVLSHIPWTTGCILPIEEMAQYIHEFGDGRTRLLVDGAQSAGVLPLDLSKMKCDFFAFPGHKWLCGPEGAGGFYVHPEAYQSLESTFVGPLSIDVKNSSEKINLWPDGRRFEVSTRGTGLYAGLVAMLDLHKRAGSPQDRFRRIKKMACKLYQGLRELEARNLGVQCLQDNPPEAGLVLFRVTDNKKLVLFLESKKLLIREIPFTNCVRVSIHYFTLSKEIDQILNAIELFCKA